MCWFENFADHFLVGVGVGGGDEAFVGLEKMGLFGEVSLP